MMAILDIPNDWEISDLESITTYIKGYAFKSEDYTDSGTRIIRVSDTTFDSIKNDNPIFIKNDFDFSKWKLKKDDLVFTTVGSRPPMYDSMVGKVIRISQEYEGCLLNQNAVIVRSSRSKIHPDFLYNNFKKKRYLNFIEGIVRGNANQVSITLKELFAFKIPLPPLPEQQKIAEILSTWDLAIEKTQKLIQEIKLRNKGLAQQLLTGKKRLKGFEEEWEILRADEIFKSHTNKSHNGDLEILSATQERGVIPRSMNNIDIKYDESSLGTYKKVEIGDYVISLRSFQGGIEYSEYEGIVSPAYTILKELFPISKLFFKIYFKTETFISRLNTIIYGIRDGKQISFKDFATLKLPYPSIEEQIEITSVLEMADNELKLYQNKLATLKEQKKGLMQKLLTGQIRVK